MTSQRSTLLSGDQSSHLGIRAIDRRVKNRQCGVDVGNRVEPVDVHLIMPRLVARVLWLRWVAGIRMQVQRRACFIIHSKQVQSTKVCATVDHSLDTHQNWINIILYVKKQKDSFQGNCVANTVD